MFLENVWPLCKHMITAHDTCNDKSIKVFKVSDHENEPPSDTHKHKLVSNSTFFCSHTCTLQSYTPSYIQLHSSTNFKVQLCFCQAAWKGTSTLRWKAWQKTLSANSVAHCSGVRVCVSKCPCLTAGTAQYVFLIDTQRSKWIQCLLSIIL